MNFSEVAELFSRAKSSRLGSFFVVFVVLSAIWAVDQFVFAEKTKVLHVFATKAEDDGWNKGSNAVTQDLSFEAGFADFSEENSAFVRFEARESSVPTSPGEYQEKLFPEEGTGSASTSAFYKLPWFLNGLVAEAVAKVSDADVATTTEEEERSLSQEVLSPLVTPRDVALCTTLQTECHILELSGFGVSGEITQRPVVSLSLNLSFASRGGSDAGGRDRIILRMLNGARWEHLGEVELGSEISNARNAGYHTFALPSMKNWADLVTAKITVEYVRESSLDAEAYLDGAWFSVEYIEDDLVSFSQGDLEGNVTAELATADSSLRQSRRDTLELSTQDIIRFSHDFSLPNSEIAIKSDQETYSAFGGFESYIMVANDKDVAEDVRLTFHASKGASIEEVSRWSVGLPFERPIVAYDAAGYFCETGWKGATSSEGVFSYLCDGNDEIRICDELNEEKNNCVINETKARVITEDAVRDGWESLALRPGGFGAESGIIARSIDALLAKIPEDVIPFDLSSVARLSEPMFLEPGQAVYVKIKSRVPINSRGSVVIEARTGSGSFGVLPMKWSGAWNYRIPLSLEPEREISEESRVVLLDLSLAPEGFWQHVQPEGEDIRFVDRETREEIPFRLFGWQYEERRAQVWVRVPKGSDAKSVAVDMYYGNSNTVAPASDDEIFRTSVPTPRYVVFGGESQRDMAVEIVALDEEVRVEVGERNAVVLQKGGHAFFEHVVSGEVIRADGAISGNIDAIGDRAILAPASFAASSFVIPAFSEGSSIAFSSLDHSAKITNLDGVFREDVISGSVLSTPASFGRAFIAESDQPVIAVGVNPFDGRATLYPPTTENIFSVKEGRHGVAASADGTSFGVRCERGEYRGVDGRLFAATWEENICIEGDPNATEVVVVEPGNYAIGTVMEGSSAGAPITPVPLSEFDNEYVLPEDAVAVIALCAPEFGEVLIDLAGVDGNTLASTSCSPRGKNPGKAVFFNPDQTISAGTILRSASTTPFAAFSWVRTLPGSMYQLRTKNVWGRVASRGVGGSVSTIFGEEKFVVPQEHRDLDAHEDGTQKKHVNTYLSQKREWNSDEKPEFLFEYIPQSPGILQGVRDAFGVRQFTVSSVEVVDARGTVANFDTDIQYLDELTWGVKISPRDIYSPGRFILRVSLEEGGKNFVDEFDFYWGTLTLNTHRATYLPGQEVRMSIGAVSDLGSTLCSASLRLWVSDPLGTETEVPVVSSPSCLGNNKTEIADYEARYIAQEPGAYRYRLARLSDEGYAASESTGGFVVATTSSAIFEREMPTRANPRFEYELSLRVRGEQGVRGEVTERLPIGIHVLESAGAVVSSSTYNGVPVTTLTWQVDFDTEQAVEFSYVVKFPEQAPAVFRFGPSDLRSEEVVHTEERTWETTSDDTGRMMLFWDGGALPQGWSCVSCGTGPFSGRLLRGSDNPSTQEILTLPFYKKSNGKSGELSSRGVAIIAHRSAGVPEVIPSGATALFDLASSSLPIGWMRANEFSGHAPVGAERLGEIGTMLEKSSDNFIEPERIGSAFSEFLFARAQSSLSDASHMVGMWYGSAPKHWKTLSLPKEKYFGKLIRSLGEETTPILVDTAQSSDQENITDAAKIESAGVLLAVESDEYTGDNTLGMRRESREVEAKEFKRDLKSPLLNDFVEKQSDFSGDELPYFHLRYKEQGNMFTRVMRKMTTGRTFTVSQVTVTNGDTEYLVNAEAQYLGGTEWNLKFTEIPRTLRPGKYHIKMILAEGSEEFTDEFDFYWGVLAINTNKSIYEEADEVYLQMAALDDKGNTICDANLDLVITSPEGASSSIPILETGSCGPNNVTDIPDYVAYYTTGVPGTYTVTLLHRDRNEEVVHEISDSFIVSSGLSYVVERSAPTRIYPPAPYRVKLSVTALADSQVVVTDIVPEGFIIRDEGEGRVSRYNGALHISWTTSLEKGEKKDFEYTFDAPDISPYLYLIGPAQIWKGSQKVFEEKRTWKIASDALGEYVEKYATFNASSAGSWHAIDLSGSPYSVPANAVLEIGVINSDTANERIGGIRHASSTLTRSFSIHEAEPQGVTMFTMHVQASATSSIQVYAEDTSFVTYVLLGYWTNGYYRERMDQIDPGITNGTWGNINLNTYGVGADNIAELVLGNWNATTEYLGGVRRSGSSLNRYVLIHESEAGGVNGYTALVTASTTSATIQGYAQSEGANGADIDYWLMGYWSQSPTGLAYTERFDDLGGPTSVSTWTDRALDSFGVPTEGIAEVVFANIADANNSQLIGVRTNGSTLSRTHNLHEAEAGGWTVGRMHVTGDNTASATIEYFTDDLTNDAFRLMGYWSPGNYPPNEPTLYDTPFDNEKNGSSTPMILFSATDPDGTSDIVYEFELDDDPVLDSSPIISRLSSNETGCSPNCFSNVTTPVDTSPFTEGNQIRFTVQSALTSGTTYYWRVRARDVTGSNLEGDWSDVFSFTYVENTDPEQWSQTQDTQFEQGTLNNLETYGSNSVRIVTSAPTEALIAYGEGTVQTPRYRIWDGSAWGGELSAQSVGGTIQWTKTKAGPTRNEYILGTQDASNDVNVQVYNGSSWGNLQEVTTGVSDNTQRGFDIAYESTSGDALVVYCDGDADPSYYVWNGSLWTGPSSINLGSANNCEWITLASDPVSDEIIVVSRDTGAQYEAQVWDGSAWSESVILGQMNQVAHEGIAVEYEESGGQAVVVVSNNTAANFTWTSWDGTDWTVSTTQGLGDDFEWGVMKRDEGSDNMVLCYADEDDDMGIVRWDGDGWLTNQEFETDGNQGSANTIEGRPISCEFETTTGRDGYIMAPYSDLTAGRYQFWNGITLSGESSISTIQDSWTVSSIRTGEGDILAVFFDDVNSRYDFSGWNGTTWSAAQTLENAPSVTAEPFREPVSMAARLYQSQSGTITSDPVDFDLVPSQPSWGEVLWNTTEPTGTNVLVQVLYATTTLCNVLVPNVDLPGNSAGFDVTESPLNISSLSTSTYNQLCLRATLSSTNQNNPTLNEWSLSWERQPYLTQQSFRWYVNAASATTTDPWPSGATDLNENETISQSYAPSYGNILRLRMSLLNENVSLSSSALSLKLQYAQGVTCSASLSWYDVGAIGSTTASWRGYNNSGVSDGATLSSPPVLSGSDVVATYEEENNSATNPFGASVNQEVEWDWVLEHRASSSLPYCFRVMTAQGELLNAYTTYPSLITNSRPDIPTQEKLFDNEQTASTTPWFEFVAEDPEGDNLTYEIEVDDDYAFGSPALDRNSLDHFNEFSNIITPSNKDPFTSGETVRFVPTSALSNATTYYWRVRVKDPDAANEWSDWSEIRSFTVNTATTITTWFQTTEEQFLTGTFDDAEATSTDDVVITPPLTTGTSTSPEIDFDWKSTGNSWGSLSWTDNEATGDIRYHIEYYNGSTWVLIPDADLPGNNAGFGSSPVSLLSLNTTTYNQIRIRANLTNIGGTPRLTSWTISWGYAVEQPTLITLFDNEKTATTTPSFTFYSTDPQNDSLEYEISWASTTDFAASTTRNSLTHSGFVNTASSTDTTPFVAGNTIRYTIQSADALVNGRTYWWRVRARDPSGGNTWSVWSTLQSFTTDTSVVASTWHQTTKAQFDTDTLSDVETSLPGSVNITSTIREALVAYAEGTVQAPRYRLWNGSSWGTESTAQNVADVIRFIETDAAPTRDEYALVTQGSTGGIDVQVYSGATNTWGNKVRMSVASNLLRKGFDVAYETSSGDAMVVSCDGSEALYRTWNGTAWSATTTLTLSVTNNCEWIRLASDPASDEIIVVVRDTTAGGTDYQALVWNGSAWGNSMTMGSQATAANEGMAVEYEESGGQAVVVVANGTAANFIWNAWNGSVWAGTNTVTIGNDFAGGRMVRDVGTDNMALCYVDVDLDIGYVGWNGTGWGVFQEFEFTANSASGRPVACQYETLGSRDGYVMIPYSDNAQAEAVDWNGSIISGATILSTITDAVEMLSVRTGDGNILVAAYDDANTEYDFTYWNGSTWSTEEVLDSTSITTLTPPTIPIDLVARRYPSFNSGTIVSPSIDYNDGTGPKWDDASWVDTTPGTSDILVQVEYLTATGSWALIPDSALPGNSTGTGTSPIDLGELSTVTYNEIRLVGNLACSAGDCPTLLDWTVRWSEGLVVSGTARQYDQSTNVTSGTVAIAVNGVLQSGKTSAISAGAWSISNVTIFSGDTVTVWVDGAADTNEAVAVSVYDGVGDVTGLELYERHLSIGSNDATTTDNLDLSQYDNGISGDEDIFHEVDGGNDLTVCSISGCSDVRLYVRTSSTYRPDSTSSGNITTHDLEISGTLTGDGNTISVSGSWENSGTFTSGTSHVRMTATTGVETIVDSTATSTFHRITFGVGSGTATWEPQDNLDVNDDLAVDYGTLGDLGGHRIYLAGNLSIGASGIWTRRSSTTTFDGSVSKTWTDSTVSKQNLGDVLVDGTSKTVTLSSSVAANAVHIGANDTLSLGGGNTFTVYRYWDNTGSFVPVTGTVTFAATTSGATINPGNSSFYNLTFNGVGGDWSFTTINATTSNTLTISTGTPTFPSGTLAVGANFDNTGGSFIPGSGIVRMFSTSGGRTVRTNGISFNELQFSGSGGAWSFSEANATTTSLFSVITGTVTLPSGTLAVGTSFINSGTVTHNSGIVRMNAGSGSRTITFGGSSLANLQIAGAGSFTVSDANATTTGDVAITLGTLVFPSSNFGIGGSFLNTAVFTSGSSRVLFSASSATRSIAPGNSSFYQVNINGTANFTITQNATSTNAFTITSVGSFTLNSGVTLAVGGNFSNLSGGASTTWTGSTLFLNSSSNYTINTKTLGADVYDTLKVGPGSHIRMWNSSATTYTTDSTASLYSQDHAAVDGALNIYGNYSKTSGSDYWSYATDFDGTVLGSPRQVSVRFANNATTTYSSGSTLEILGAAGSTTTIDRISTGSYDLIVSSSTINAQYYQFANLSASGVTLSSSTTVLSLSRGVFSIDVTGGSAMTIASQTVAYNSGLQIFRVGFFLGSAASGFNVTETGTTGSSTQFIRFREHYGDQSGEAYDADGGNPGDIRWDDSQFVISISGTVYSDAGATPMGSPVCDGSTQVVRVKVNGAGNFSAACNSGDGTFTVLGVTFQGDTVMTTYLDTNGGANAVTVTRSASADLTGVRLYQDRVIVRHEDSTGMSISDLGAFHALNDNDVPFTVATSGIHTLTVDPETELWIWTGKTFTPGGNVTLLSGGSGNSWDGTFHIDNGATFVAQGTETHSVGGRWVADSGATFTSANSLFVFTATTSGKLITAITPKTFYDMRFSGAGGNWSLNQDVQVDGDLEILAGTLSGAASMTVNGTSVVGDGAISFTGGTFTMASGGLFGGNSNWLFNNLTFSGASATTSKTGSSTVEISRTFSVFTNHSLLAGTSTQWDISGTSSPFVLSGTLDPERSTFRYKATSSTTVTPTTYWKLWLAPFAAGSPTYTLGSGTFTLLNMFVVGDGTNPVTVNQNTNDPTITANRHVIVTPAATLVASDSGVFSVFGDWENDGTFTASGGTVSFVATSTGRSISAGGSSFGNVLFNSSDGGWTIPENATATGAFTLSALQSFTVSPGIQLSVGGVFTNSVGGSGTTWADSILHVYSGTSYSINTKTTGADTYGVLSTGANTQVRMWDSLAATTSPHASGSVYSQDHAAVSGELYIWGAYTRSSGGDYWSYETDFDGVTTTGRQVNVRLAPSASVSVSGGALEILGTSTATTTIDRQSTGNYGLSISGGSTTIGFMSLQNANASGLSLSGTAVINALSDSEFELGVTGGTLLTVAGTVIDANPLKTFFRNRFATTTSGTSGSNVTATGSSVSAWRFNLHTGGLSGEAYDTDPGGDPGYIIWDDSAANIVVSGNVYSDEGVTPIGGPTCDGVTQNVRLRVQGLGSYTSACNASTGAFSISNVIFNPGDTLSLYLDTNGGARAANISVDPSTNIANMHLYQNRVIVRHEDADPMTIAAMDAYDQGQDSDIPFTTSIGSPNTLTLRAGTGLIVWDGKTFDPGGNMTLHASSPLVAWDGTIRLSSNATLSGSGRTHVFGGSFLADSGASVTVGSTTMNFTATTSGRVLAASSSQTFGTLLFSGSSGAWDMSGVGTTTGNVIISAGTVTLPAARLAIGGSFDTSSGVFVSTSNLLAFFATSTGNIIRANGSNFAEMEFRGGGGSWRMIDTNATSTGGVSIATGTVNLPAGSFAIGGDYLNQGGLFGSGSGMLRFTSSSGNRSILFGSSTANHVQFAGSSTFAFLDTSATSTGDFLIFSGTTTFPATSLAIGGNFASYGAFTAGTSTVSFVATSSVKTVEPRSSMFGEVTVASTGSGGISMIGNATTTLGFNLRTAPSFALASGATLAVGGRFTNAVGGAGTTWTGSTLSILSGENYSINEKTTGGDGYGYLRVSSSTQIRSWNSSSTLTYSAPDSSWYSQDNGATDGSLSVYGNYVRTNGTDYWNYANDFDGTVLSGGSRRQVNVRLDDNATTTFRNNSALQVIGGATATTTIDRISSGSYAVEIESSTLSATYHQWRNIGRAGLNLSGTTTLSSFGNGDFELATTGGTLLKISSSTIDQNASQFYSNIRFATSTGVSGGANVTRVGTTTSAITFQYESGNFSSEANDEDGDDACGSIRFSDSACLFVDQSGYRFRNDDGGEGVEASRWYDSLWTKRQRVRIQNTSSTTLSDVQVKLNVLYDADMQSDFDDIRFTDSSGTSSLSYWIQETVASASSSVWVRVPSISASSYADVYMYYGNNATIGASSGTSTFKFFDDFETVGLTDYAGDTSLFEESTSFNYQGTRGLDTSIGNESAQTTDGIGQSGLGIAQGSSIRFYQYIDMSTGSGDETCTLFAVGSPFTGNQNYAVCLEPFQQDKVIIAENVSSNDNSGTQLASTSVTFATGWYEVNVDWLVSGRIDVTVYNSSGSFFASTTVVDSSHTTGGIGFSFWGQHGGWDLYTARTYYPSVPTATFGIEQGPGGATWEAAENIALIDQLINQNVRLRFAIKNSGTDVTSQNFRLQVAPKGVFPNCESVSAGSYSDVTTTTGGCGTSAACMTSSSQFTNYASTTQHLSIPNNFDFAEGQILEDPSNETTNMSLLDGYVTEVEYNFQMTAFATQSSYCFRVTDGGVALDNYSKVPELRVLQVPSISNWSFNGNNNIALTEGTTTRIYATGTVTDFNGYTDIVAATSTYYRSGATNGRFCSSDGNDCYQIASSSCGLQNCSGNSCEISCSAFVQYFADPTDLGSTYASQIWDAFVDVWDTSSSHATASSTQDIYTLRALDIPSTISYGSVSVGGDTGATNASSSVNNTGNAILNLLLSGTNMTNGSSSISADRQKYATTTFTYSSCTTCSQLSTTSQTYNLNVSKPTSTSAFFRDIFWGLGVPSGTAATTHSGTNDFLAN